MRRSKKKRTIRGEGGVLMMRFKRFLRRAKTSGIFRVSALLAIASVVGVCTGRIACAQVYGIHHMASQNGAQVKSVPIHHEYQRWLNEDVRWIITPEERATYLSLKNDDERDFFIKQFWERRNPPGAPPNTFREEHYRRIAYANEHFAFSKPGWETDRGRIYIEYGPPDKIDYQQAEMDGVARPGETWHYRSISEYNPSGAQGGSGYRVETVVRRNVDVKFVDVCSCGDYQLQSQ